MFTTVIIALNLCYRCKHVSVGALLITKHLSYPILSYEFACTSEGEESAVIVDFTFSLTSFVCHWI